MIRKAPHLFAGFLMAVGLAGCDGESQQQKVEGFLSSAADKLDAGKHQAAIIEFKNALQIEPQNARARRRLGELYLSLGRGKTAAKEFDKAIKHGAKAPGVEANLARARLLAGEPRKVLDLIPAPGDSQSYADGTTRTRYGLRAQALHAIGDTKAAETLAREVLAGGESAEARLAMAKVRLTRGDGAAALKHVAAILDERPTDPRALWLKGRVLLNQGKTQAAVDTLQTARQQQWRPIQVDLSLIELALRNNDTDQAWSVLADLKTTFGDDPRVRYFEALKALHEKRYEDARQIAEGLSGRYTEFGQAAYVAGAANLQLENHEMARSYLERFVNRHPESARGRALLARAWMGLGNRAKAERVLGEGQTLGQQARERQVASTGDSADPGPVERDALATPNGRRQQVQRIFRDIRNGEYDAAMAKATTLEEKAPDNTTPGQIQAVILWSMGDRAKAIARLQDLAEQFPDQAAIKLNLARMHRALGETDKALSVLEPAMRAHPDHAGLKVEGARNHARRNNGEKVRGLLGDALDADPKAVDARAYLARFHLLQGEPDKAIRVAEAAPDEQATSNPALLEVIGRAARARNDGERALSAFKTLTEAAPDAPAGHLRMGETLLAMNRPADAIPHLETARELSDAPKEAAIYLGRALLQAGKGERADELIADLEDKYPQESDVAVLRGNHALSYARDTGAAVAAFEKALAREPSERRLFDLVRVQTRVGRRDAAIERLQAWRESHDASAAVDSELAKLHLAAGNHAEALQLYTDLVERNPDNAAHHNNLAWTLAQQDKLNAALTHAEKAAELAPDNAGVLDTLGFIQLRQGNAGEAREHLAKAATAAPNAAGIQLNYAEALIATGERDKATGILGQLADRSLSKDQTRRVERLRAKAR